MWRTSSAICASVALASLAFALPARAYDAFASSVRVEADASFTVTETVSGSFAFPRHGIYRAIPVRYDAGHGLRQTIVLDVLAVTRDGAPEPYEVFRDGDYATIKIGDADVTFAGPFVYEIAYRVERAVLYGDQADTLYWNVTGDQWDEGFRAVTADVSVAGVGPEALTASCYTGPAGSTEEDCVVETVGGNVRASTGTDALTVVVSFPKGIAAEPSASTRTLWWIGDNWKLALLLIPLAAAAWAYRHWSAYGRDPKGRGTIVAEYASPDDLTPAEVGTLVDAQFHDKDFAAAIVELAVRGYVRITEEEGRNYVFARLKDDTSGLRPFEAELMRELFGDKNEVSTKDDRNRFMQARKKAAGLVCASMAERGYYVQNPETVRSRYMVGGMLVIFLAIFIPPTMFVLIPTGLVFVLLGAWMPRRTDKGQPAFERARGFQEYLSCAEKYRIQWQEKEGILEKFLPFAMAFGVADKWTKALADTSAAGAVPGWYVGRSITGMSDFGGAMGSLGSSLGTASAPKSGGGGSSGGGFGGGGGGSW